MPWLRSPWGMTDTYSCQALVKQRWVLVALMPNWWFQPACPGPTGWNLGNLFTFTWKQSLCWLVVLPGDDCNKNWFCLCGTADEGEGPGEFVSFSQSFVFAQMPCRTVLVVNCEEGDCSGTLMTGVSFIMCYSDKLLIDALRVFPLICVCSFVLFQLFILTSFSL